MERDDRPNMLVADTVEKEMDKAEDELKNSTESGIDSLQTQLKESQDSFRAKLDKAEDEPKNSYEPKIDSLHAGLDKAQDELKNSYEPTIDSLRAALDDVKDELKNSYQPKIDSLLAALVPLALRSLIDDIVYTQEPDTESSDPKEHVPAEDGMLLARAGIDKSEMATFLREVMACTRSSAQPVTFEAAEHRIEAALRTPGSVLSKEVLMTGRKLLHSHARPGQVLSQRSFQDKAKKFEKRFIRACRKKAKEQEYEKQVGKMEEEAGFGNPFD